MSIFVGNCYLRDNWIDDGVDFFVLLCGHDPIDDFCTGWITLGPKDSGLL